MIDSTRHATNRVGGREGMVSACSGLRVTFSTAHRHLCRTGPVHFRHILFSQVTANGLSSANQTRLGRTTTDEKE